MLSRLFFLSVCALVFLILFVSVKKVLREIAILMRLQHPAIVKVRRRTKRDRKDGDLEEWKQERENDCDTWWSWEEYHDDVDKRQQDGDDEHRQAQTRTSSVFFFSFFFLASFRLSSSLVSLFLQFRFNQFPLRSPLPFPLSCLSVFLHVGFFPFLILSNFGVPFFLFVLSF